MDGLTSRLGSTAVISLTGKHDVTTARGVRKAIARALEHGTHLVVDLTETDSIDASIVRALVDSEQLASRRGLRISLQLQKNDRVKRLLGPATERRERWRCSWL